MTTYSVPEGSLFEFSNTFSAPKIVASATNADPGVFTSTAHGFDNDNELLTFTDWDDANNTVFLADQLSADTFALRDLDTSDTKVFRPGWGIGSVKKVTNWTKIPGVVGISSTGGDAKFTDVPLMSALSGIRIPNGFNPVTTTLKVTHDPKNATYKKLATMSRSFPLCAIRITALSGVVTYSFGYVVLNETPTRTPGNVNQVDCVLAALGRTISY